MKRSYHSFQESSNLHRGKGKAQCSRAYTSDLTLRTIWKINDHKKHVEDIIVAKNVKHIESLRHENDTFTKILSRTFEGNVRLNRLLRESRHPSNKQGLGYRRLNIKQNNKDNHVRFTRSNVNTLSSEKKKMYVSITH